MKYLKLFEELKNKSDETLYDVIEKIMSGEYEPMIINEYFGDMDSSLDEDLVDDKEVVFYITMSDLSEVMVSDGGVINWIENTIPSNAYEYSVDNDDIDYIHRELSEELLQKITDIANWIDWDLPNVVNIDYTKTENLEGEISKLFKYLDIYDEVKDCIDIDMSYMRELAVKEKVKKEIFEVTPFETSRISHSVKYSYRQDYDTTVSLDYKKTLNFLEKFKSKNDIYDIPQLFKRIGKRLPYSYYLEFEIDKYEKGPENLNLHVDNILSKYWEDDKPTQLLFVKMIQGDLVDDIKEHFDEIEWNDIIESYVNYESVRYFPFQFAKEGSECYKWFGSDDFINRFKRTEENKYMIDELKKIKMKIFGKNIGLL